MDLGQCDAAEVVWGLIDVSGGIKSRGALQDAVFVGQELNVLPKETPFFPVWAGIGTARYSKELDTILTQLIREGRVYDTGGPASLKALKAAPDDAKTMMRAFANKLREQNPGAVSMVAAYLMAQRKEPKEQETGAVSPSSVKRAAKNRLGWPKAIFEQVIKTMRAIKRKQAIGTT